MRPANHTCYGPLAEPAVDKAVVAPLTGPRPKAAKVTTQCSASVAGRCSRGVAAKCPSNESLTPAPVNGQQQHHRGCAASVSGIRATGPPGTR
jgi:hypothetical protein